MKKTKAIKLAGGTAKLAEILGVSSSAVSQWTDSLPASRIWQLKVLRPDWFRKRPA